MRSLTAALVARGVRVEPGEVPPGECERLAVTLSPSAEGVKVGIVDPWGRSTERTVKELLTSASLIESWARLDLLDGVSTRSVAPAKAAAAPPARVPVVPADVPEKNVATLETAAAQEAEVSLSLRVLAEGGVSRDRQKWMGGSVAACAHLGFLCLGLEGRYARGEQGQNAAEALLILEAPITLGFVTFTPGLGAGAGWLSGDRGGRGGGVVLRGRGDHFMGGMMDAAGLGPRAEARLGLALNFTDHFGIELGASASAIPELRRGARGLFDPEQAVLRAQGGLVWSFE